VITAHTAGVTDHRYTALGRAVRDNVERLIPLDPTQNKASLRKQTRVYLQVNLLDFREVLIQYPSQLVLSS
jgi:hypothetical protein